MPVYEFECPRCEAAYAALCKVDGSQVCPMCGAIGKRLMSAANIVMPGNMGAKLKTRVNLSDELDRQGISAPLFSSPEKKDRARWALKKEGL
jgi:putative FmdB family regulatory protein